MINLAGVKSSHVVSIQSPSKKMKQAREIVRLLVNKNIAMWISYIF